jgi:hypothetical protein
MLSLPAFGVYDLLIFVLIFSLVYAVLSRSKFFYKSDIPALIAIAVALISLGSAFFVEFVVAFLPYVLALLVFIFVIMLLFSTALVPTETVTSYLKKSTLVPMLIIFIMFIFGLVAYGIASGQNPAASTSGSGGTNGGPIVNQNLNYVTGPYIISILTTPQVLSLLLTLIAMAMAVYFMTRPKGA